MNPFELRFSIFNTAKDLLFKQHESNLVLWESLSEASKASSALYPKFPTIDEIVEKALEINKFVSDANERELTKIVKRVNGIGITF